jgi:hypothetical protein
MAKHYETCGGSERWNFTLVLESKLWEQQQHRSRQGAHYARFMRPACHRFVLGTLHIPAALPSDLAPETIGNC